MSSYNIIKYLDDVGYPSGWEEFFDKHRQKLELIERKIKNINKSGEEISPNCDLVFRVFYILNPKKIKVVILGQDPYPQKVYINNILMNRAQGLSFSLLNEDKITTSLGNIFKELHEEYGDTFNRTSKDLIDWVHQGVFLLNTALTVSIDKSNSHTAFWESFINSVITYITVQNPNVIFVLWGEKAKSFKSRHIIGDKIRCLEGIHPSGYNGNKFIGCNHFIKINEILTELGEEIINWDV